MKRLIQKTFHSFIICCLVLFIVTTPLFYIVTKHFYAEDLIDIITAVENGKTIPPLDLEEDIMEGMMLQFILIFSVVSLSLFLTIRFVTKHIWQPFEDTLQKTEYFNISQNEIPEFLPTKVIEFDRLNSSLNKMMKRSQEMYRIQKEFTENASHELQTPLAVTRSKLDLLMQEELTEQQMKLVADLYQLNTKMEHLNRNLLLLAKIENSQYGDLERINLSDFIGRLLPSYNLLKGQCSVDFTDRSNRNIVISANPILLECMLNNLVVNAIRHTISGEIHIILTSDNCIEVKNPSEGTPLNAAIIFRRFRSDSLQHNGTGLGLAIVKAICDFHKWDVSYCYLNNCHLFKVDTTSLIKS